MTNHEDPDLMVATHGPPATPESVPQPVATSCTTGSCPTVYRTDRDTVLVQGYPATDLAVPDGEVLVEIPLAVLLDAARALQQQ